LFFFVHRRKLLSCQYVLFNDKGMFLCGAFIGYSAGCDVADSGAANLSRIQMTKERGELIMQGACCYYLTISALLSEKILHCTSNFFLRGYFLFCFLMYIIQHSFFCRTPDFTHCVGGCWDRLPGLLRLRQWQSDALTTWLNLKLVQIISSPSIRKNSSLLRK
jgi:hypothetical protein